MTAEDYLNNELGDTHQTYDDVGVTILSGIEHSEMCRILDEYHEHKLKLLGIGVVSTRLKMGAKVYKKDKTLTGFIDRKADVGFNHWIVIWKNGEQTKEYGSDLNVC